MAKKKGKGKQGARGNKHRMTIRKKDREKFYRNYAKKMAACRAYDKSLWGRWIRCRKYMNASEKRSRLGIMEYEEWEKLWKGLPLYKEQTPFYALRARHGCLPRVTLKRIDDDRGMFLDNVLIVFEEKEGQTVLYDGNKQPLTIVYRPRTGESKHA
jgi:hypothetical protein